MGTLDQLPADILLEIVALLPLCTIFKLAWVSKVFARFMKANESPIFHYAAVRYGFSNSIDTSLEELKAASSVEYNVNTWKGWCMARYRVESSWMGVGSSNWTDWEHPLGDVHWMKFDEKEQYVLMTSGAGGLIVKGFKDQQKILWALPKQYFHDRYLEYSHGFLIFERTMDQIEIWRKSVDYQLDPAPSVWVPDQKQMEFSLRAQKRYPSKTKHGHFQPWALLSIPNVGMGYGFAYPNLLVASTSTATIWNVLTCQAVHQFNTMTHYALNSIDFNDQHAFICTPDHLRIFSHDGRLVWTVAAGVKSQEFYSNDRLQITPNLTSFDRETKPVDFQPITPESPALQKGSFHAVNVSPCGKNLVIMFNHDRLLVVRDFHQLLHTNTLGKPPCLADITTEIHFNQSFGVRADASCLVFEHGRIALATSTGLYIITLDSQLVAQGDLIVKAPSVPSSVWPNLWVSALKRFSQIDTSCLEISETKLLVSYGPDQSKNMCELDFHSTRSNTHNVISRTKGQKRSKGL